MTINSDNRDETQSGQIPPPMDSGPRSSEESYPEVYPSIGDKLPPHYEINAEIGRGGYGRVYQVWNTHDKRREALKVMWCDPKNPDHRKRCESEIKLLINMPPIEGIVRVYRSDSYENWVYYAMELILDKEGNAGKNIVEYARENSLPFKDRLGLLAKLCETVTELHKQEAGKLIHRDIKPSNVLIRDYKDPVPMLMDYGISRKLESEETRGFTTRGGPGSSHPGSPLYMAPEQMEVNNKLTPAVDIYALANLVFMVLSDGIHPLQLDEETHFTRQKWVECIYLRQQPRSLCDLVPDVTPELNALLAKALSYEPEKRPTAKKFGDGLREALQAIPRFRIFISAAADMGEERALAEAYFERVKTNIQRQVIIDYAISPPSEDIPARLETFDLALILLWSRLDSNQRQLFKTLKSLFDSENPPQKARPKVIVFRKTANFTNGLEDDQKVKERHREHQEMLTFLQETKTKEENRASIDHLFDFTSANVFPDLLKGEELWSSLQARIYNLRITDQARPHLSDESPFRGLSVFERKHADIFFGRDREISEVIELFRIQQRKELPFVIIYGASGVGKSSFAQAGVLARIIKPHLIPEVQQWRYAIIRPGEHGTAIRSLAQGLMTKALPELRESLSLDTLSADLKQEHKWPKILTTLIQHLHDGNLLLIIDQMEDIFALNTDEKDGEPVIRPLDFFRLLVHLCRSQIIWILATVRNDHYPQVTEALARANVKPDAGRYDLLAPNTTAMRAIIEQPAQLVGLMWGMDNETGETVSDVLLKTTAHRPDSLPLLEFTLDELYKSRSNTGELTAEAYHQLDGIEGAIGNRAEAAFTGLRLKQPEWVLGKVFRQLIRFDTEGKPLRDYASFGEIGTDGSCKLLVDTLIKNRLLITSVAEGSKDGHITVVHEALFSHWPQLKTWIDAHKTRLQVYQRIKNEARAWEKSQRDSSLLIPSGRRLEEARKLLALDWDFGKEKAFVLQSQEHADLEKSNKEKLQKISERRGRHIKYVLVALAAVFFVSAVWIYKNYIEIKQQKQEAVTSRVEAEKNQIKAEKNFQLAVENAKKEKNAKAEAQENAQKADEQRQRANHELGRLFLIKAEKLIEEKRYEEAFLTAAHAIGYEGMSKPPGFDLKVNPSLYAGSRERAIARGILFKFETNKIRRSWISPFGGQYGGRVSSVSFSPDGKYLASAMWDKTIRLWDIKTGESIKEFNKHTSVVESVVFSPDGKVLASASRDRTVRLWDVITGESLREFNGHKDGVKCVSFSPDGKVLASASEDRTVRLWDVKTGESMLEFKGHTDGIESVVFSPDGKVLASASRDKTVRLWDVKTGESLREFKGHMARVMSVSFSPDGKVLASASEDITIRLWDVITGESLREFKGYISRVLSVSFSPDGKVLASGSGDRTIRLWDVKTGKSLRQFNGHSNGVESVVFSPDGKVLASASEDKTIRLWDVKIGKSLREFNGHSNEVESVVFSPDGKVLVSACRESIRLWDVKTGKSIREFKGHTYGVESVVFSPDGKYLASPGWDKTVRLWDVITGESLREFKGHTDGVKSVSFSPDGKVLASASWESIRLWDVKTGESIKEFNWHSEGAMYVIFSGKDVTSVVFSPDGKYLASACWEKNIRLWDVKTGESIREFKGHTYGVESVVFSPDGKYLTSASLDNTVWLWDVKTGEYIREFKGHTYGVASVVFSPDGKYLASASWDKTVRLWDVKTGDSVREFKGHSYRDAERVFRKNRKVLSSASSDETIRLRKVKTGDSVREFKGHSYRDTERVFRKNRKVLSSASSDKTIRLWDVKTGEYNEQFKLPKGKDRRVVFSPDGKVLAFASSDETIRLWDVKTGEYIEQFKGHIGRIRKVVFSPDGKVLASASRRDNTVRLWDVKTGGFMRELKGHTGRNRRVVFSPDGKVLAFASRRDNTIRLWDVKTGGYMRELKGHTRRFMSVVFSPDGKVLASASSETIRLWDVKTGDPMRELKGHMGRIRRIVFSPDGKVLTSASLDNTVWLWDVKTGESIREIKGHTYGVASVFFSPDGKVQASASWDDKTIRLWDVKTGDPMREFNGHTHRVNSVVFSPDGKTLASCSFDETVRLWNINTGVELAVFTGHMGPVRSVSFSPNGESLVSRGDNNTVRLWDVEDLKETATFMGVDEGISSVAFSPDGKSIAFGCYDRTVHQRSVL